MTVLYNIVTKFYSNRAKLNQIEKELKLMSANQDALNNDVALLNVEVAKNKTAVEAMAALHKADADSLKILTDEVAKLKGVVPDTLDLTALEAAVTALKASNAEAVAAVPVV